MPSKSTHDVIVDAARTLFAERGFRQTTIRDIAKAAEVSPTLVMKLTGSKADLFRAAAPEAPTLTELEQPTESTGRRLVRAIVDRRDADDFEYWASVPFTLAEAADRSVAQEELLARVVPRIAATIGDDSAGRARTRLVISLLLGLASGLRTVEVVTPESVDNDTLIETYGALVQQIIDDDTL